MSDEIKNCPWCGGYVLDNDDAGNLWQECNACGLRGPVMGSRQQAIAAWNDLAALREERDTWKEEANNYAEAIDNVRASLGLEATHYLVIHDQVGDVMRERDALREERDELRRQVEGLREALRYIRQSHIDHAGHRAGKYRKTVEVCDKALAALPTAEKGDGDA